MTERPRVTPQGLIRWSESLAGYVAGFDHWGEHVFRSIRGENVGVMYDRPQTPPWRRDAGAG